MAAPGSLCSTDDVLVVSCEEKVTQEVLPRACSGSHESVMYTVLGFLSAIPQDTRQG